MGLFDSFRKSAKEKGERIAKGVRGGRYEEPFSPIKKAGKNLYYHAREKVKEEANKPIAPRLVSGYKKVSEGYQNVSEGDRVSKIRKQGLGKTYKQFGSQGLGFLYGSSRKSKGRRKTKTRTTRKAFDFF